jgi:hypothetical protein
MPSNEWNNFTQRINQFRIYKGYSAASFTTATAGTGCTPSMLNEAINAINGMGFSLPQASSGNISASTFINMRDTLNSIN